jgi:hypothetical protein
MNDVAPKPVKRSADAAQQRPDDAEIFAACPLMPGENREDYKRLYLETWAGILPRDGYEKELVRQMVNHLWRARQYTRLASFLLRPGNVLVDCDIARQHPDKKSSESLVTQLLKGSPGAVEKAGKALGLQNVPVDLAALVSLEREYMYHEHIQEMANRYQDNAAKCMQRLLNYRERRAKLWTLERA